MVHQGIQDIQSSTNTVPTKNVFHFSLNSAFGTLGTMLRWVIILIGLCLIVYGLSSMRNSNEEQSKRGNAFVRFGIALIIMWLSATTVLSLMVAYGLKRTLITLIIVALLTYVMIIFPQQLVDAITKSNFFEWFQDNSIEQEMLKTYNGMHLVPWGVLLVGVVIAIIIFLL